MAVRLTNQPIRLAYTRRDLDALETETQQAIKHFIPTIKDAGQANTGTKFRQLLQGLVDTLNYSLDTRFRQSTYRTVEELQAALDISEVTRYVNSGVSSASSDLLATTLTGPATVGGIPIPQYQQFGTNTAPVKFFFATDATSIPEGASSVSVPVIQGLRVVDQVILAAAAGSPSETILMPVALTPHAHIEITVDGLTFTRVDDFKDSQPVDRHFVAKLDEDGFSSIIFGDDTYGLALDSGAEVRATYIQSLGIDGNVPPGTIVKVLGTLAASIAVTNVEASTGGASGDTVEDIARNAPRHATTFLTGFNNTSFESLAETLVPGVFKALADEGDGPFTEIFILPHGGGVASTTLLNEVEEALTNPVRLLQGVTITASALQAAHILIDMRVVLFTQSISKTIARKKIYEAIAAFKLNGKVNPDGALYYTNLTAGRGFTISDMSRILEEIDSGDLVDYVDFLVFTRYPTPVPSNPSSPVFRGEIEPLAPADYDDWMIQAITTTTFSLFKNGILDSSGDIGVTHTSDDGSIKFTLGLTTDTFTVGDNWTFSTSAYRDNMRLGKFEFMTLARDSDLRITIYFPGEFTVGTT